MATVAHMINDLVEALRCKVEVLPPSIARHDALQRLALANAAMGMENPLYAMEQLVEGMKSLDHAMYHNGMPLSELLD